MDIDIGTYRKRYDKAKIEYDIFQSQLNTAVEQLSLEENALSVSLKARIVIQTVAEQTQKQIEYHISNLVTLALASVFPDPYTFILRFVQRRNKTEADLLFSKDGNEGRPLDVSGGGPIDVAAYALRPATWSLEPTRNTFILDEPFRYVSRDLQHKCSEMVHTLGERLSIQHILISHIPEIIDKADTVFDVTNVDGVSTVNCTRR
jgi:DNA repair exonuclease SbcCD ATPase subunit